MYGGSPNRTICEPCDSKSQRQKHPRFVMFRSKVLPLVSLYWQERQSSSRSAHHHSATLQYQHALDEDQALELSEAQHREYVMLTGLLELIRERADGEVWSHTFPQSSKYQVQNSFEYDIQTFAEWGFLKFLWSV